MVDDLATVQFHGDTIFTVRHGGDVCVAPKPISDRLGLSWGSQHNRINRDPVLKEGFFMTKIPSLGGDQETNVLRLNLLPGWLFGIDVKRVRADRREAVLTYKRECYAVLYEHFFGRPSSNSAEPSTPRFSPAVEDARKESLRTRRQLVSEARQTHGTNIAREMWFYLDMPITPSMVKPAAPELPFTYTAVKHEADPEQDKAA